MDFVICFLILANWKGDSYNLIFVIVDWLTKMVHYKLVKITFVTLGLVKVIMNMIIYYYKVLESIIITQS